MNSSNFKVIIRVRPLQSKQKQQINAYQQAQSKKFKNQSNKIVKLSPMAYSFYAKFYNISNLDQIIKIQSPTIYVIDPEYKNIQKKMKPYTFSQVYAQSETSRDIYQSSLKNQINCVFQGYNCTVLAYGITGSGKTHTIFGNYQSKQKGISELIFSNIIENKKSLEFNNQVKVSLAFSFVQIYNQNVRDLLTAETKFVNVIQDSKGNTSITDLLEVQINSVQEIMQLVQVGLSKRSFGATNANQYSSRSHAVLQMNIKIQRQKTETNAKMFIIDLAGSEKLQGLNSAKKMQQGANINKSLLSLGNCITILADNSKKNNLNASTHIPYRDSKLTRILKDSLGGNAKTIMISCISSNPFTIQQTTTTLNYAQRAQGIKKIITKNQLEFGNNRQCNCKTGKFVKKFKNKLKQVEYQLQQKQKSLSNLFNQIYQDLVDNIIQGQKIKSLSQDSDIYLSKRNQIQSLRNINARQRIQLKQTMTKLFQQKNKIYMENIKEFIQKQQKLCKQQPQVFVKEKYKTQIDQNLQEQPQKDKLMQIQDSSLFTQFTSLNQPLKQLNINFSPAKINNKDLKLKNTSIIKNLQNQNSLEINQNIFSNSAQKKFSFGQIQQTPNKQCQQIELSLHSQNQSGQKPPKKRSKSKFEVVKKVSKESIST